MGACLSPSWAHCLPPKVHLTGASGLGTLRGPSGGFQVAVMVPKKTTRRLSHQPRSWESSILRGAECGPELCRGHQMPGRVRAASEKSSLRLEDSVPGGLAGREVSAEPQEVWMGPSHLAPPPWAPANQATPGWKGAHRVHGGPGELAPHVCPRLLHVKGPEHTLVPGPRRVTHPARARGQL